MLIRSNTQASDFRSNHRQLRLVEVAAMNVQTHDEIRRIGPLVVPCLALDVGRSCSQETISTIKDLAVQQPNRLADAMLNHVVHHVLK